MYSFSVIFHVHSFIRLFSTRPYYSTMYWQSNLKLFHVNEKKKIIQKFHIETVLYTQINLKTTTIIKKKCIVSKEKYTAGIFDEI